MGTMAPKKNATRRGRIRARNGDGSPDTDRLVAHLYKPWSACYGRVTKQAKPQADPAKMEKLHACVDRLTRIRFSKLSDDEFRHELEELHTVIGKLQPYAFVDKIPGFTMRELEFITESCYFLRSVRSSMDEELRTVRNQANSRRFEALQSKREP